VSAPLPRTLLSYTLEGSCTGIHIVENHVGRHRSGPYLSHTLCSPALCCCVTAADRQIQIVELGGLRLLLPLTKSTDVEVQRLAAHALANLSVNCKAG
jgi:hypothetical protein